MSVNKSKNSKRQRSFKCSDIEKWCLLWSQLESTFATKQSATKSSVFAIGLGGHSQSARKNINTFGFDLWAVAHGFRDCVLVDHVVWNQSTPQQSLGLFLKSLSLQHECANKLSLFYFENNLFVINLGSFKKRFNNDNLSQFNNYAFVDVSAKRGKRPSANTMQILQLNKSFDVNEEINEKRIESEYEKDLPFAPFVINRSADILNTKLNNNDNNNNNNTSNSKNSDIINGSNNNENKQEEKQNDKNGKCINTIAVDDKTGLSTVQQDKLKSQRKEQNIIAHTRSTNTINVLTLLCQQIVKHLSLNIEKIVPISMQGNNNHSNSKESIVLLDIPENIYHQLLLDGATPTPITMKNDNINSIDSDDGYYGYGRSRHKYKYNKRHSRSKSNNTAANRFRDELELSDITDSDISGLSGNGSTTDDTDSEAMMTAAGPPEAYRKKKNKNKRNRRRRRRKQRKRSQSEHLNGDLTRPRAATAYQVDAVVTRTHRVNTNDFFQIVTSKSKKSKQRKQKLQLRMQQQQKRPQSQPKRGTSGSSNQDSSNSKFGMKSHGVLHEEKEEKEIKDPDGTMMSSLNVDDCKNDKMRKLNDVDRDDERKQKIAFLVINANRLNLMSNCFKFHLNEEMSHLCSMIVGYLLSYGFIYYCNNNDMKPRHSLNKYQLRLFQIKLSQKYCIMQFSIPDIVFDANRQQCKQCLNKVVEKCNRICKELSLQHRVTMETFINTDANNVGIAM